MALFNFHFDRPGPGVSPDAPRKKGPARFFEMLGRDFVSFYLAGMLALAGQLCSTGVIGFDGALVSVVALMSSFGSVIALANLGTGLQNTFAAGNRVLDILDDAEGGERA